VRTEVIDGFVARYESDVGALNGARVVARAWVDPDYRARLLADATPMVGVAKVAGPGGVRAAS
jgi:nitrile hydratase subunit alpha